MPASPDPAMPDRPCFIVGSPRSGTTLLGHMLSGHRDLDVLNEMWRVYHFLTTPGADLGRFERLLLRHFGLDEPYLRDGESLADPFDHLERAFALRLAGKGKTRWGVKDPRLTDYLDLFAGRYQDGRFVVIVRDPRAAIVSRLGRQWSVANVYSGARLWAQEVARQRRFVADHPDRALLVRFEDLLDDPERWLSAVCEHLQLAFTPELLDFHARTPDTPVHAGNANITRPIQRQTIDKWRDQLTPRQVAIIDTVAGAVMAPLGYGVASDPLPIGRLERLAATVHQDVMLRYWWQKHSNWSGLRRRLGLPVREAA